MAAPRLPFLWPILCKPIRGPHPCVRLQPQKPTPRPTRSSQQCFATTTRRRDEVSQRYGTAQEPLPHLRSEQQDSQEASQTQDQKQMETKGRSSSKEEGVDEDEDDEPPTTVPPSTSHKPIEESADSPPSPIPMPAPLKTPEPKPLDTVLHMPSPAEEEQRKPPHLKTPPYVHHFDTYSLVKDLTTSGFTQAQSVTVMKAVRDILTDNIALARQGLVSKSNVENETYLFRAACSELRTEIGASRKSEVERMRSERGQLQHEVDLLGQRLGQETGYLKDELKGLFDDRKMAVRQEQRVKETKIQELNYQITIKLTSDARSEVEGLRWVLTRRAAMTIGICAFMLFVALRYSSYVTHQLIEVKKEEEKRKSLPPTDEGGPGFGGGGGPPATGKPALGEDEPIGGELLTTEGGVSLA
ncbi:hypothetical protein DM02DRAFT_656421 [Periconia macrospinosa]|uniref:DUF1640-domain-containing protein n=1 Tax=Periconia macrospinosa TaxID=97972 RepID=A0A2V1DMF6_9PLEO|nr:hypothetical protein DM02DRAFT_656421 [Periconia macrospinosa]